MRELEVERRKRQRLVIDYLDSGPSPTEHNYRSKGGIVGYAGNQLTRQRANDHQMYGDAGEPRAGFGCVHSIEHLGRRLLHGRRARQIEPHAANIRFVDYVR